VKIRLATEITGVDCDQGELSTAKGDKTQKDLVIIADGAHVSQYQGLIKRPA
jgi:hypothetical protein